MDFRSRKTHSRLFLFGTVLGVLFALFLWKTQPTKAATGINQQINFQGRLLNSAGATVPDGFYNIQFKIYQDGDGQSVGNTTGAPAGSLKWTESYLNANSQGVKVFNGFLSVSLGSVNAFGSSIDWNQSVLWLSMNIGSTNASCTPFTSCTPDGEMIPMQPLTSAVYAMNAMQLGGLTASSFGQLSANQTWTGINTYRPAADATNVFQLQKSSTGVGYITADSTNTQLVLGTASSLTGKLAFATAGGGTLTINPTSSASSFTITLPAETGTVCTTAAAGACSVAGAGFVQLAPLAVQVDATNNNTIFVNKTSATGNILELQKNGSDVFTVANNGNVTATGTINGDTISSTALTFGGANPVVSANTANTGLTVQSNGTGTLTLNSSGAGTVNLGASNTTAINIGSSASAIAVLGATTINTTGTAATTIGNAGSTVAIASSGLNLTTAGALSGVTTLGLSGAITGATATNTINGIIINSQAVSNVTTLGLSGAITGATATNTINGLVISGGALSSVTGITSNGSYTQSGSSANTLTGATTLSGNLIVTGAASVAVQKGTDFSTTGPSVAASFTGSLIRLTGGSTQTIQGITGATDGRIITLVNSAGQAAVIANQFTTGTAASERIITGTGADISLAPDTSIELRYDITTTRWRVVGSVGGTSVTTVGAVSGTPTANGATITGNTLNLAVADGSNAGLVSTSAQTFNGVKTFNNNIIAPTSTNTINGLIINAGALSGIAGYTQTTGAFAFSGGGNFSVDSAAFDVTTAGAVSGVTTLGLSGAITGATATNTINGLVINSGALSSVTGYTQTTGALAFSGGGNLSVDSAAFDVTTAGAVSGVTTLNLSGAITGATATNTINGVVINSGALTSVTGITTNGGYTQSGSTANTLTGATTISGNLIVTGAASVAVQKGTDFSTTGPSVAASFTGSLIRLTGASTQTIQAITGATDGRIITLVNAAAQAAVIANQFTTGTTAAERIITGTGADISLAPDATLELRYDTTASRWRVVGGSGSGANVSLSNLSGVAINTSLLPASNNSINLGSNSLAFASGFFGTNVQAPLLNTADISTASTASAALTVRSGNATGTGGTSGSGALTIKSGDSTNGISGAITIDTGTAGGGNPGALNIGNANSTALTIGNTGANTTNLIQGGSGASAIQINQGLGGTITIGTTGSASTVNVQCGSATTCGFANNATDHSTTVGSTSGTSVTTLQSGSGGITLTGNISASGTYNTNTFNSTTLTFAGANPTISPSTTNTGLTLRANGTGILTLNTSGAGTVNLGTANSTTLGIGNSGSTNTVLGATTLTGTTNINNTGTSATTIGQGTSTSGTILIQGGVSSTFSVTNSSGSSVLSFAAPSTAGIVTYQLPAAGTGGNTYGICTTLVVCSGYGASGGANTALSNLAAVAINTSLLPASNNAINVGSTTLAFASGYFATNVQAPLVNTFDQTAGSTNSVALVLRSGNTAGATSNTGAVTLKSGDATTGNSGNLTIDSGTASGTKGTVSIGSANTNSLTLGNTTAATQTLIQGGTGGTAVSIQAGASGAINIGTTNINSVSIGATTNTGSLTFGQSTAGETVNISNGGTAAATTVNILSGVGTAGIATLNMGNNTRITGISLGNINPAAARTIDIGNNTGTGNGFVDTINIATNPTTVAGGNTVNIASGTPTGSGTNLVTIGSLANASTTIIQGGTGANAIQITQATGAGVIVGNANTGSTVTVQCGAGTSSACGFGTNGNDHTTTVGSTVTASQTVIQSGTSGISLNGAVTTSSTINTNTFSATALTFTGANPVISASTTNTGMTLQSNGTGTLTLNSSGAGIVNVGTTNTTTVNVGNTTAATQTTINGGTGASALSLQVGSGGTLSVGTTVQTTNLNIGNTSASTVTNITGGTGTTALNAQVGNGGSINIGTTAQTSVQNIGNTSASTLTLINGGTSATAIQVIQGAGGTITVGGTGAASNVLVQCGASATSCNFGTNATDHTTTIGSTTTASLTTIQAGTSGISLAQNTTLAANRSLTFAAGTGQYIQTGFSGTNTDAFAVTASSLTTGAGLRVTTTNNSASATTWNANQFNMTNAQGTTAATLMGVDYEFTQAATVAGNTETVANFAIAASGGSPTDNTVDTIVNVANNDTATGNLVNATNGIKITATTANNIINAISLSGSFQTNLITTSTNNFTLTAAGAVTQAGNLTLSGTSPVTIAGSAANGTVNLQANGTGTVAVDTTGAGTASLGGTNATTVNVGNSNSTNVSVSCAASATTCNFGANTTDHTTNIGSSTSASLTNIQGGTSGITLTSGSTVASVLSAGFNIRTSTNSATAFRVQNTGSNAVVTVDTSTPALKVFAGAGGANYLGLTYNDGTSTGTIAASSGTTAVGSGTGAISVLAGSGAAITITGNATSLWRTTAGTLTMQSGTSSDLILTSGSNIVQISGSSVVRLGQNAGDPGTCTAGALIYNTTTNTLRGCQGSSLAWFDLVNVTTPTMQQTYDAAGGGTTPEIKLGLATGVLKTLDIQGDNAATAGTLLAIRAGTGSGLGTAVFSVTTAGTTTIQTSAGVDLLTADAAGETVQVGSSGAHSTNPIQLVLDNYQPITAGAEPTNIDGAMYYDAENGLFRCSAGGFWQSCSINSIQNSYVIEEEFIGGTTTTGQVGTHGWNLSTIGATGTFSYNTTMVPTADRPGVFGITTPGTSNQGNTLWLGGQATTGSLVVNTTNDIKAGVSVGGTAASSLLRVGLLNETTGTTPGNEGIWIESDGTTAQWRYCYGTGSAATCAAATTGNGFAVNHTVTASTWVSIQIRVISTTSAIYCIDGDCVTKTLTGIGVTNRVNPAMVCQTITGSARNCYIDYYQLTGTTSAAR